MSLPSKVLGLLLACLAVYLARSEVVISRDDGGMRDVILAKGNLENNFTAGTLGPDDIVYLILTVNIGPTENETTHQNVSFLTNDGNITYILGFEVGDPKGGSLLILGGGPGYDYVDLQYQSALSMGINITAMIYGTPPPNFTDIIKSITF